MPVATASSGRALYDRASAAFVHNMPLEALNTVHAALETGQARATQQLAEQFFVLQITALCAIYSPNDPATHLEIRMQQWRQQQQGSGREMQQMPSELLQLLTLPPQRFFGRLWTQALRFYSTIPALPAFKGSVPSADAEDITPQPETATSALQLPSGVVEALVLGALKVDEDMTRHHSTVTKGNSEKALKPSSLSSPALNAARAMCEWVLTAHASIPEIQDAEQRKHLYTLYGRALRLYALEILGMRLQEWEHAGEVVRCAKLIQGDEREIEQRSNLLADIAGAQGENEARLDRQRLAKERARQILQEQLEKRKMEATATAAAAVAAQKQYHQHHQQEPHQGSHLSASLPGLPSQSSTKKRPDLPARPRSLSSSSSQSGGLPSPSQEKGRNSGLNELPSSRSLQKAENADKPKRNGAPIRAVNGDLSRDPRDRRSSPALTQSSLLAMRDGLLRWLRGSGGTTTLLIAVIVAALTVLRRTANAARGVTKVASSNVASRSVVPIANSTRRRPDISQGFVSMVWNKLIDTVRMGTQVTYL